MRRRHLHLGFALAAGLALCLALFQAYGWSTQSARAQALQAIRQGVEPGVERLAAMAPEVQLAAAARRRAEGHDDEALRILQPLAVRTDLPPALRDMARYNLSNALLRLAGEALVAHEDDRALTLLQLAKQRLRETLQSDPDDWDARHNLQLALRLAPEQAPGSDREVPTNVQRVQIDDRGIGGTELP